MVNALIRINLPDLADWACWMPNWTGLDWAKILSVGEQQRVAFAHVLLAAPKYAVLDEATSTLDIDNEDNLYRQLAGSATAMISVGHRPSILKYHPQVLELDGHGGWQLYAAQDYRFEP